MQLEVDFHTVRSDLVQIGPGLGLLGSVARMYRVGVSQAKKKTLFKKNKKITKIKNSKIKSNSQYDFRVNERQIEKRDSHIHTAMWFMFSNFYILSATGKSY